MATLTEPQRAVLFSVASPPPFGGPYRPYGSQWPSIKRLMKMGLIERTGDTFILAYRLTDKGREVHQSLQDR